MLLATAESEPDRAALVGPEPLTFGELAARVGGRRGSRARHRLAPATGSRSWPATRPRSSPRTSASSPRARSRCRSTPDRPSLELGRELDAVEPVLVARVRSERRPRPPRRRRTGRRPTIPVVVHRRRCLATRRPSRRARGDQSAASDLAVLLFTAGTAGRAEAGDAHARFVAREPRADAGASRVCASNRATSRSACCRSSTCSGSTSCSVSRCTAGACGRARRPLPSRRDARPRARRRRHRDRGRARDLRRVARRSTRRRAPADAFARVRLCVSGAAPLPRDDRGRDARTLRRRRARRLRPHRGVAGRHDDRGRRRTAAPGSIGPPLPGVEVRLVDDDGNDVLAGDPGEILVRGANVFAGYWNDPEATARGARRRLAAHRRRRRRRRRRLARRWSTGPRTS